jgi:hypothetical protein
MNDIRRRSPLPWSASIAHARGIPSPACWRNAAHSPAANSAGCIAYPTWPPDHRSTKLVAQLHVHIIGGIATRGSPYHRQDPIGMRFQDGEIEIDRWILPKLVFNQ